MPFVAKTRQNPGLGGLGLSCLRACPLESPACGTPDEETIMVTLKAGARVSRGRCWAALAAIGLVALLGRQAWAQGTAATPSAATLDTGDTAWMLTSAALVMLMVPGLALFYGGMVRRKNVLATMMHSIAVLAIIGVEWVLIGYPMVFGTDHGGVIGWDSGKALLWNVLPTTLYGTSHVPEYVYAMYQGMFAIITPALIAGAFAERVKFKSYAVFALLWGVLVYNPVAHWIWGGGWLGAGATGLHLAPSISPAAWSST